MDPDQEGFYFLEMKKIAEDILKEVDTKRPFRDLLRDISKIAYSKKKEDLPEHTKKTPIQMQEDLFHVLKYLLIKKLPGNNVALFIGRMQPPTKLHIDIIRQGLKDFDNVVVAIVKGKKSEAKDNPFPFSTQEEMIHSVFPDVKVIQVGTGNVLSAMNASDENINAILCGSDRVEGYRNQLKNNPEIAVVETMRDESGVSGTKLRKALLDDNKVEFEKNADPKTYKFFDRLKKEIKGETSERFMSFEDFSMVYEAVNESFLKPMSYKSKPDSYLIGEDVKDEDEIQDFIEYYACNKMTLDIWKYAKDELKIYPNKLVAFNNGTCAFSYSGKGNTKIEIEVKLKEAFIWHFSINYRPEKHDFDNQLIRADKFSYKNFKEYARS